MRSGVKTKRHSRRRSFSLPAGTVVMAIAGSRCCSSEPVGEWVRIVWSVPPPQQASLLGTPVWRREGLKVPQKPRGRVWRNDGSCVRLRPERRNHVWSYDFVSVRTHDGRSVRLLHLIDEHTRESLLVRAERRWPSSRVISALDDVLVMKGVPEHLRSDNGPEFVAKDLRKWLAKTGAKALYLEPGSPWENG